MRAKAREERPNWKQEFRATKMKSELYGWRYRVWRDYGLGFVVLSQPASIEWRIYVSIMRAHFEARTCRCAIHMRLVGFNLLLRSIVAQSRSECTWSAFTSRRHNSDVSERWRWICFAHFMRSVLQNAILLSFLVQWLSFDGIYWFL